MEQKVAGIVLNQIEYKDNDAIISFLSDEGEHLTFYAYGVKKITSKNAVALQPLTYSEVIYFKKEQGLQRIKTAQLIHSYSQDYSKYDQMIYGFISVAITNDVVSFDTQDNFEYYQLLKNTLTLLGQLDEDLVLARFLIEVMKKQGIHLVCNQCALCQNSSVHGISISAGGFICNDCGTSDFKVDQDILKLFRFINLCDFTVDHLKSLKFDENNKSIILQIIVKFFIEYTGINNRSLQGIID